MLQPVTKKQRRAFLRVVIFCKFQIPAFGETAAVLVASSKTDTEETLKSQRLWTWEKALVMLKVLVTAPTFVISNYSKPFHLLVSERLLPVGSLQTLGEQKHPAAYHSALKHPVTKRKKRCIRMIPLAALMVEKHQKIELGHLLIVNNPHNVELS